MLRQSTPERALRASRFACAGRSVIGVAALATALASTAPLAATPTEPMVRGLIVQLREAPSHAELARERALAANRQDAGTRGAREQARWQGVLVHAEARAAGLRVSERRAVGAAAQLVRFDRPMTMAQAQALATELAQRPDVASVALNTRERRLQAAAPSNPPTDPDFGGFDGQWWLQPVGGTDSAPISQRLRGVAGFQTAWTSVTTGSPSSLVAVLDNGITFHPDLVNKVVPGYDMVSDVAFSNDGNGRDSDPTDPGDWVDANDLARPEYAGCALESSSWHGTAIAGMLVANANNDLGGASINWPGKVLAVRVAAKCGADVVDIVDGMRWVAGLPVCLRSDASGNCLETSSQLSQPRARVINISFGGTGTCDAYQPTIDQLRGLGVVVVAAAGNEHAATPTRPAKCPGVIGVAALNRDGFKTTYSNFGPMLTVATVGGDDSDGAWGGLVADSGLLSVGNNGTTSAAGTGYFNYFGTSFSTPGAAGAVSLMLAVNPALTAAQIEQGLRLSARPHVTSNVGVGLCSDANPGRCLCTTATCGAGILDVPQALAYAAAPGSYVRPAGQPAVIDSAELLAAVALGPDRPSNTGTTPPAGGGSGSGNTGSSGGGAMSGLWLLALAAACLALARRRVSAALR
jgi:serine protease